MAAGVPAHAARWLLANYIVVTFPVGGQSALRMCSSAPPTAPIKLLLLLLPQGWQHFPPRCG